MQTIIVVGDPGGSFTLTLSGDTTSSIPFGSSLSTIQSAIQTATGLVCTVEFATASAYLIITEPDEFFTLFPKNYFSDRHNHNYLPEYTTRMNNDPASGVFAYHSVTGTDSIDDVQTFVVTGDTGLFSLTLQYDDDDSLEYTKALNRGTSAAELETVINTLPTASGTVTVVSNSVVAYLVTFLYAVGIPGMTATPSFVGGTYPFMAIEHTYVGGALNPSCCDIPSVTSCTTVVTASQTIVTQRLTR